MTDHRALRLIDVVRFLRRRIEQKDHRPVVIAPDGDPVSVLARCRKERDRLEATLKRIVEADERLTPFGDREEFTMLWTTLWLWSTGASRGEQK